MNFLHIWSEFIVPKSFIFIFVKCHKFFIGFASAEFAGQSNTSMCLSVRKDNVDADRWQEELSCCNMNPIANYVYVINNLSLIGFRIQLSLNSFQNAYTESWKASQTCTWASYWIAFLVQICLNFSFWKRLILWKGLWLCVRNTDSSLNTTYAHLLISHCCLNLAHCNLPFPCLSVTNGCKQLDDFLIYTYWECD